MKYVENLQTNQLTAQELIQFEGSVMCGLNDVPKEQLRQVCNQLIDLGCKIIMNLPLSKTGDNDLVFLVYTERQLAMLKLLFK